MCAGGYDGYFKQGHGGSAAAAAAAASSGSYLVLTSALLLDPCPNRTRLILLWDLQLYNFV